MSNIKNIFNTEYPVIGMIHFGPLLGYSSSFNVDIVLKDALADLASLEKGGVDAVMIENNYDTPHKIKVGPETVATMTYLLSEISKHTKLPLGVSVLWNDYEAALSIAKICGAKFVRVPVFVDEVETSYGRVIGNPQDVLKYRKFIEAEDILLLTDIHVKHAQILTDLDILGTAKLANRHGSDGLIVTGKWTGDAPDIMQLSQLSDALPTTPIFVGSGASAENIKHLAPYITGVIVSTALKEGAARNDEINIKASDQRIDRIRVKQFVDNFQKSVGSGR